MWYNQPGTNIVLHDTFSKLYSDQDDIKSPKVSFFINAYRLKYTHTLTHT